MTPDELRQARRRGAYARMQLPDWHAHQVAAGKRRAQRGDMAAAGRKGAEVYIARYGRKRLQRTVRAWRLQHPTRHELQVAAMLDRLQIAYEREAVIFPTSDHPLAVDFALPGKRVIEVNGAAHTAPWLNGGDPNGRQAVDSKRLRRLHRGGYQVLTIDHRQFDRAEEHIQAFLRS